MSDDNSRPAKPERAKREQSSPQGLRLLLPSSGELHQALPSDLADLDASQIALVFTLMESDINFDGLQISTDWLDPSQANDTSQAIRFAQMVDAAINRAYAPDELARIRIEGLVPSRDAVRWLRALRMRSHIRPSALTQMALLKS